MARHRFAILDPTTNLADLKAALAPLALIGDTVLAETVGAQWELRRASARKDSDGALSSSRGRRVAPHSVGHANYVLRPIREHSTRSQPGTASD